MPLRPHGFGGGGAGGGLSLRSPVDRFTGANLAACRTARDAYFGAATNAAALAQFQAAQGLAIILAPTSGSQVFQTYAPGQGGQAYAAANWLDRTDAVRGPAGADGRDGTDGADGADGADGGDLELATAAPLDPHDIAVLGASARAAREDHRHKLPLNATPSRKGLMSQGDKQKLDSVETGATADQDATEIRAAVGDATASAAGMMSAGDKAKLDGIEAAATADQTGSEITAALDSALGGTTWRMPGSGSGGGDGAALSDDLPQAPGTAAAGIAAAAARADHVHPLPGEATDDAAGLMSGAEHAKLAGIEAAATADQTPTEIRAAVGDATASAAGMMAAADFSKLAGIEAAAKDDQTGSEIVAAIDAHLGSTDWQSGGGGGGGGGAALSSAAPQPLADTAAAGTASTAARADHVHPRDGAPTDMELSWLTEPGREQARSWTPRRIIEAIDRSKREGRIHPHMSQHISMAPVGEHECVMYRSECFWVPRYSSGHVLDCMQDSDTPATFAAVGTAMNSYTNNRTYDFIEGGPPMDVPAYMTEDGTADLEFDRLRWAWQGTDVPYLAMNMGGNIKDWQEVLIYISMQREDGVGKKIEGFLPLAADSENANSSPIPQESGGVGFIDGDPYSIREGALRRWLGRPTIGQQGNIAIFDQTASDGLPIFYKRFEREYKTFIQEVTEFVFQDPDGYDFGRFFSDHPRYLGNDYDWPTEPAEDEEPAEGAYGAFRIRGTIAFVRADDARLDPHTFGVFKSATGGALANYHGNIVASGSVHAEGELSSDARLLKIYKAEEDAAADSSGQAGIEVGSGGGNNNPRIVYDFDARGGLGSWSTQFPGTGSGHGSIEAGHLIARNDLSVTGASTLTGDVTVTGALRANGAAQFRADKLVINQDESAATEVGIRLRRADEHDIDIVYDESADQVRFRNENGARVNVHAGEFYGDGSHLTGLPQPAMTGYTTWLHHQGQPVAHPWDLRQAATIYPDDHDEGDTLPTITDAQQLQNQREASEWRSRISMSAPRKFIRGDLYASSAGAAAIAGATWNEEAHTRGDVDGQAGEFVYPLYYPGVTGGVPDAYPVGRTANSLTALLPFSLLTLQPGAWRIRAGIRGRRGTTETLIIEPDIAILMVQSGEDDRIVSSGAQETHQSRNAGDTVRGAVNESGEESVIFENREATAEAATPIMSLTTASSFYAAALFSANLHWDNTAASGTEWRFGGWITVERYDNA